jgi:hypothetical protein
LATANYGNTVSVLPGNGDGSFGAGITYPVGSDPEGIVPGDFNRDGRPDLAVGNAGDGTVSILLGSHDGTFQPPVTYPVGPNPLIAGGDFNGDGCLDLAVSSDSGASVLLGNGDGTFLWHDSHQAFEGPISMVSGDFNGDGHLDLTTSVGGGIALVLGNGDGTFQPPIGSGTVTAGSPSSVATGDFNGDGRLDMAVSDLDGSVQVLLGNGDGTFPQINDQVRLQEGQQGWAIVSGDFNDDGRLDLAVSSVGGKVSVLLGNGDGTFQLPVSYAVGFEPYSMVAGDFNGDGNLDLAAASAASGFSTSGCPVSILLGNGDGTFRPQISCPVPVSLKSIVAGDFDGDGHIDLAVFSDGNITSGSVVVVLRGDGDGTFHPQVPYRSGPYSAFAEFNSISAGDFNGDGYLDLAALNTDSNTLSVLLGNGDDTFKPPRTFKVGSRPVSIVSGDFNDDGHLDLATLNGGDDTASVLLGDGDGTFRPQVTYRVGPGYSGFQLIVTGDVNGDGRLDLAVEDSGTRTVLMGRGDGTFAPSEDLATSSHATPVAADVQNDGAEDMLLIDESGQILYRSANPIQPGTFEPPVVIHPGSPSRDIAWVSSTNQGPVLASVDALDDAVSLYGWREGRFLPLGSISTGRLPARVITADLNQDGRTDLIVPTPAMARSQSTSVRRPVKTGSSVPSLRTSLRRASCRQCTFSLDQVSPMYERSIHPETAFPIWCSPARCLGW